MVRQWLGGLTVVLGLAAAVWAEDAPLKFFAEDVDVLIRLHEPDKVLAKVAEFVDKVQPGMGEMAKMQLTQGLGEAISNPELTGVDQSRDWYVGVYANGEEEPTVVFAIPAVDSDDLVEALGDEFTTEVKDRWVLYTEDDEFPEVDESATAASSLGKKALASLNANDLGIYVNASHLTEIYSEQIELGKDQALEGMNALRAVPPDSGVDPEAMITLFSTLADAFFQAIEDSEALSIGVSLADGEIKIDDIVEFADESSTAKFLADHPPGPLQLMEKLPDGAVMYMGMSGITAAMNKFGVKMSEMMASDEERSEKIAELLKTLDDVKFGAAATSLSLGDGTSGLFRTTQLCQVQPVDKVQEMTRSMLKLLSNVETPQLTQETTLDIDAETIEGHKIDVTTIKQEFGGDDAANGLSEQIQTFMVGPDGMQTRTAWLDGQYATTMGGGQEAMAAFLKLLDSSQTNSTAKLRKTLQDKSNVLVLLDLPSFLAGTLKAVSQLDSLPIPLDSDAIENLDLAPSYLGFSVSSEPNTLHVQTRVPSGQILGMTKLVMLVQSMLGGGAL